MGRDCVIEHKLNKYSMLNEGFIWRYSKGKEGLVDISITCIEDILDLEWLDGIVDSLEIEFDGCLSEVELYLPRGFNKLDLLGSKVTFKKLKIKGFVSDCNIGIYDREFTVRGEIELEDFDGTVAFNYMAFDMANIKMTGISKGEISFSGCRGSIESFTIEYDSRNDVGISLYSNELKLSNFRYINCHIDKKKEIVKAGGFTNDIKIKDIENWEVRDKYLESEDNYIYEKNLKLRLNKDTVVAYIPDKGVFQFYSGVSVIDSKDFNIMSAKYSIMGEVLVLADFRPCEDKRFNRLDTSYIMEYTFCGSYGMYKMVNGKVMVDCDGFTSCKSLRDYLKENIINNCRISTKNLKCVNIIMDGMKSKGKHMLSIGSDGKLVVYEVMYRHNVTPRKIHIIKKVAEFVEW